MYAKQVGTQVALVMDEDQAEELYGFLEQFYNGDGSVCDEAYEALGPIMEG